ncbi:hypothetical protein LTR12_017924 [Friedmanniomyces endolithicus]|nr:hypothetical protein LTR74_004301 [Friedmanniomyces endolithicus]KAK1807728.1 hypothetical protein LTR12_017924 [Friedmanniomyces endolithicus]
MGKKAGDSRTAIVNKSKAAFGALSTAGLLQSKHTFPFDKLPPELRNRIYRLVLVTAEGPIEITGHISAKFRNLKHQPCSCDKAQSLKCSRCKGLVGTETFKIEAKTLVIEGNKCRRKPLMKKAYGGAIVSINRQVHREGAAILCGENVFVFGSYSVFQRFYNKIGRKIALLKDIEIMNFPGRSQLDIFTTLPTECKLQRVKICPQRTSLISPSEFFKLLVRGFAGHQVLLPYRRTRENIRFH